MKEPPQKKSKNSKSRYKTVDRTQKLYLVPVEYANKMQSLQFTTQGILMLSKNEVKKG